MSTNADNFHELLNGLLDGVLTDDEQRQLDLAMKEDPTLEDRLNELQAMRNSLLRGRSVGRLGPEFSQGVVAAARKRAEMMGDRAPAWLRPTVQRSADRVAKRTPAPTQPAVRTELIRTLVEEDLIVARRAWRVWIPTLVMAVAASFMVYFGVNYWSPSSPALPLVSDTSLPGESDPSDQETNQLAVEMLRNELPKDSPSEAMDSQSVASPSTIAESTSTVTTSTEPTVADPIATEATSLNVGGANTESSMLASDASVATSDMASVTPDVAQPANPIQDLLDSKGITDPFFTLAAEISVDPVAQENEILRSLMEKHEIVVADDLDLSSEQRDLMIASRMVGTLSNGTNPQQSEEVQVLFVRARMSRLDSFLVDIERHYKDFPTYRTDMLYDPTALQLIQQLSSVVTTDETARRLTFRDVGDSGLVTSFPTGNLNLPLVGVEARRKPSEQPGEPKLPRIDTPSYLILLVRNVSGSGQ